MKNGFRPLLLGALCSVAGLALAAAPAMAEGPAALVVDAAHTAGGLKPLRGVNGAPDMAYNPRFAGNPFLTRPVDVSAMYRAARVTLVRTHDAFGAGDIDTNQGKLAPINVPGAPGGMPVAPMETMFPDPAADPANPASYNFGPTDILIKGIRAIGADVMFRIGRTGGTTAAAPDPARYAEIVRHVVMHYNKGWKNGFTDSVRYWELWNEPDFGPLWWRGTPDQFYALYGQVAKAVKAVDAAALMGGPAIAGDMNPGPYREGFLDYVRQNRLPLDFFSWHHYAEAHDPYDFVLAARIIRGMLDARGFKSTVSVLDEWNSSVMRGMRATDADHAAFVATARLYMQDAPIDLDGYYRADGNFGADGRTPDKVGQALLALGDLADTPMRLVASGGDDKGLAVVAGRSTDGRVIRVLVSDYRIPADQRTPRAGPDKLPLPGLFTFDMLPRRAITYGATPGYGLTITGLTPGRRYTVERRRIADDADLASATVERATGPVLHLATTVHAPAVELVTIQEAP